MPIFEYVCQSCDTEFEALVQSGTTPECPECKGVDLKKQFSTFAVSKGGHAMTSRAETVGACGTCGDPRGPGSCALN